MPGTIPWLNGPRPRRSCQGLRPLPQRLSSATSIWPGIRLVCTWRRSVWITMIRYYWRLTVTPSPLRKPSVSIGAWTPGRGRIDLRSILFRQKCMTKVDHLGLGRCSAVRQLPHCEPVAEAVASYFGGDTPRINAEVFLPWHALGMTGPPVDRQLRVELAATAYHRARWMSWSGLPPKVGARRDNQMAHRKTQADEDSSGSILHSSSAILSTTLSCVVCP